MIRRIVIFFISLLFFVSHFVHAEDLIEKSSAAKNIFQGTLLSGGRQGHVTGFADIDGDGIADRIVGAPYASSSSNTGAVLVYKGGAGGVFYSTPSLLLEGDDNYGFSFVNLGDVNGDSKDEYAIGAISGDGDDVSLSGSVTIYKGGKKGRKSILTKLAGEGPMDKFGFFTVSGDLNGDGRKDLIVGAPFNTADPALYQGGAVYVYFAPDFGNRIILHASSSNKGLGWSAAAGDINGDNIADLCISASGKVLCYYGSANFSPTLDSPDVTITSSSSGFGKAIAIMRDLDGDGFGEIIIGAPNAVVKNNRDTGSIYIVKGGAGKRTINVDKAPADLIVRIDGADLFDRFGSTITSLGDIDFKHKGDFAVGAPMSDSEAVPLAGKVYLFRGEDIGSASGLSNAEAFEGAPTDLSYGTSISIDRSNRLLIGAPGRGANTGKVYLVDPDTGQIVTDSNSNGGANNNGDDCH